MGLVRLYFLLEKKDAVKSRHYDFLTNYPGLTIEQNEYLTFDKQTDFVTYTTPSVSATKMYATGPANHDDNSTTGVNPS
jgi:hypothetical protein